MLDDARVRHPRGVGAFQRTVSAETVRALARARGFRAAHRGARRSRPRSAPGRRASPCSTSWPGGSRSASPRYASCSIPDWWCSPARSAAPAATALADRVQQQVARLAPVEPRVVSTEVGADPVLNGALLTAVAATREEVFTSTLS